MKKLFLLILLECGIVSIKAQTVIASWNFADTNMTGFTTYHTYREYNYTNGTYVYGRDFIRKTDSLMGDNNDGYIYLPLNQVSGHGSFYMDVQHTAYLQFPAVANPTNYPIEVRFRQKYRKKNDRCFVDCYYSNHFMSVEINQNVQRDSIGPDSIAIVLPSQVSSADSIIIQIRSYMQGSNLSGYYWAIDDVEIITPPDLNLYYVSADCTSNSHISVFADSTNNICGGDTGLYEGSQLTIGFEPDDGYDVQSVLMDGIDITSELTAGWWIANQNRLYMYTLSDIDTNHVFSVSTIPVPDVNVSVHCSSQVSDVFVNSVSACGSTISIPYGSHDTVLIHTQPGSTTPKVINDSTGYEFSPSRINDSIYRFIHYRNISSKSFTINASPKPHLNIINENGGFMHFVGEGLSFSTTQDTTILFQEVNEDVVMSFITFLPGYTTASDDFGISDTNAYRIVRLYLDGAEINLDSATANFAITQYLDAILYELTFVMDTSHTIRAVFGNYYIRFTATAMTEDEIKGSVTGGGNYPTGTDLTLSAIPNYGYHFDHWSDGNTDNPRTLTLNSDTTLIAFFMPNSYNISTASNDDAMGTVNGGGFYDYNTTQMLVAEPAEGHHFVQWTDGNTDNPRLVLIESDSTFTAVFGIDTLTVNATSNNIVYGNVTGGGEYTYSTPCTIEANAYSGYVFVRWSNGVTYNPYTFAVLTNMDIEAVFAPEGSIHNVTVQVQPAGTGTVTGDGPYADGETITLEAVANEGYHFVRWQDNVTDNPRTVMVYADMSFTAFFESDVTQGIDSIEDGDIRIWSTLDGIIVEGCEGKFVSVYDMMGRRVTSNKAGGDKIRIDVPSGVYLVKADLLPARKVVVVR